MLSYMAMYVKCYSINLLLLSLLFITVFLVKTFSAGHFGKEYTRFLIFYLTFDIIAILSFELLLIFSENFKLFI